MKISIIIASDVESSDAKRFMQELDNEILNREEFKSIIQDVKVTPK